MKEKTDMSDKPMNKSRRDAVKMMMGGLAAAPLMNLVGMAAVQAEELPHVDEATDPTAIALKYKQDAAASERESMARPGLPPEEQFCHNCQFQVPPTEAEWVPCQLFPGKAVNSGGWCTSWTKRA
jgi:hypothetical protein